MLHKGDVCTYIPSGRAVYVCEDQNYTKRILVRESDVGNPDYIRGTFEVPPSDLRRRPHERLS